MIWTPVPPGVKASNQQILVLTGKTRDSPPGQGLRENARRGFRALGKVDEADPGQWNPAADGAKWDEIPALCPERLYLKVVGEPAKVEPVMIF